MDDILKEAIADAKALRATALENAKIALEEAFTPRLKNMLSQKIQSEVEDEVDEDMYDEDEVEDGHEEMSAEDEINGDEEVSEEDTDEIPAELSDPFLPPGIPNNPFSKLVRMESWELKINYNGKCLTTR